MERHIILKALVVGYYDRISRIKNQVILINMGCKVLGASYGIEALSLLEQQAFDFILLDINMAPLNGIELTKIIRNSTSAVKNISIIGIVDDDKNMLRKARNAGINEILIKPINIDLLRHFVIDFSKRKQTVHY